MVLRGALLRYSASDFNLEAPDELVSQLVTSLDLDHDGALCLSEFVAGFKEGNRQGLQLCTLARSPRTSFSRTPSSVPGEKKDIAGVVMHLALRGED